MKFRHALGIVVAVGLTGLTASACGGNPAPAPAPTVAATTAWTPAPADVDAPDEAVPDVTTSAPSPIRATSAPRRPSPRRTTSAPRTHRARPEPTRAVTHAAVRTTAPEVTGTIPCVDGTVSHAKHRQGACSHHGGIA